MQYNKGCSQLISKSSNSAKLKVFQILVDGFVFYKAFRGSLEIFLNVRLHPLTLLYSWSHWMRVSVIEQWPLRKRLCFGSLQASWVKSSVHILFLLLPDVLDSFDRICAYWVSNCSRWSKRRLHEVVLSLRVEIVSILVWVVLMGLLQEVVLDW